MTPPITTPTPQTEPTPRDPAHAAPTDDAAVRAAIHAFAQGAAHQDVELLEAALHPSSVQFVTGAELDRMEYATYLDLVRTRQLGGQPLDVEIQQVAVRGDAAQASATFTSASYALTHALSLARAEGRWVILSTVVACSH